ncbi:Ribonuclease Y [Planctomycetales bacterium 10988]|nr:Ribonuclease Y [Planctomycetales bacterium 10988]
MDPFVVFSLGAICAAIATFFVVKIVDRVRLTDAQRRVDSMLEQAERDMSTRRKEFELELKEQAIRQQADFEKEAHRERQKLDQKEHRLEVRASQIEQKSQELKKQEQIVEANQRRLTERIQEANKQNEELTQALEKQQEILQKISGFTKEEATRHLLGRLESELQHEAGALILKYQKQAEETCKKNSREAVIIAMQRYAAAHTAESTTSVVDIPSDDMKGRIIGRDGRNIRAFEKASGVDVIIDDTPGVVVVSGFDAVRREIGRISLNKLIADGRIHPSRIDEVVEETQSEMEQHILRLGQEAAQECDVQGLHPRILSLLGRLHFRTSYSQNVLRHSIEVAFLTGMMAEEIGMDGALARRCGLLHDIGKAADHEMEGGHPKVGADILKRHGERPEVVHAAFGHHDDLRIEHPHTLLVAAADACSASRPGARRETLERYVKRLEELESIATSFSGVEQAYAIQAGRELRVIVNAKETTDSTAAKICRDITQAVQEQLTYPGEIRVAVLRESQFSDVAK